MKRIYTMILSVIMVMFSLTACNVGGNENTISTPPLISTTESETSTSSSLTDRVSQSTSTAESTENTSSYATESSQAEQSSETPSDSSTPQSAPSSVAQSSSNTTQSTSSSTAESTPSSPQSSISSPEQSSAPQSSSTSSSTTVSAPPQSSSTDPVTTPEHSEPKVLVAYFSATNTTEGVAERIADALNADIYEITPETPYTSADLDYHSDSSRSTIEMNDPNARPAISGSVDDMEQYDIVFVGYPIWWGEAPRILNTFVESYDFSGKTVVPFCTSGGSVVGSSARNLAQSTSGANWLDGTRLNGSASESEVVRWINGLGLDITAE